MHLSTQFIRAIYTYNQYVLILQAKLNLKLLSGYNNEKIIKQVGYYPYTYKNILTELKTIITSEFLIISS